MIKDEWQVLDVPCKRLHLVKQVVLETQGRWDPEKMKELQRGNVSVRKQLNDMKWTVANTPTLITMKDLVKFDEEEECDEVVKSVLENVEPAWYHKHEKLSLKKSKLKTSEVPKGINSLEHLKFEFDSIQELKDALDDNFQQIQDFMDKNLATICKKIQTVELHMRGSGVLEMYNCLQSECGICFNISGNSIIRSFQSPWKEAKNLKMKEKVGQAMKTLLSNEGPGRKDSSSRSVLLRNGEAVFLLPTGCFQFDQRATGMQIIIQFEVLSEEEKDANRYDYEDYAVTEQSPSQHSRNNKYARPAVKQPAKKRRTESDDEFESDEGSTPQKIAYKEEMKTLAKKTWKTVQGMRDDLDRILVTSFRPENIDFSNQNAGVGSSIHEDEDLDQLLHVDNDEALVSKEIDEVKKASHGKKDVRQMLNFAYNDVPN